VIVDLIGFGIVMPVLPFYAKEFGASATVLGMLLMCHAAAQFVFAPLWGRLSDRIGRRPVLLMTIAGTALSLLALGLATSLPWVFAARVLGGAFAANISVASAYIADVTAEEERTRWMGMLGASFGIGFLLGPAIGGALAPLGYHVPLLVAAGLATLNWLHAVASLQEPPRHAAAEEPTRTRAALLRDPLVRRLCTANLVFSVAVAQLETVFAFLMIDRFGYDAQHVAAILVGMALLMGGVQGGGMKALARRYSERGLAIAGASALAVAFAAVPEMPSVAWLLAPLALSALGRAILQPSLLSMTSLAASRSERGAVMGAFQASASLARVVGPVAAGLLYDRSQAAPFWFASVLLVATALLARTLPRRAVADDALAAAPVAR
jgi:MFS family permease